MMRRICAILTLVVALGPAMAAAQMTPSDKQKFAQLFDDIGSQLGYAEACGIDRAFLDRVRRKAQSAAMAFPADFAFEARGRLELSERAAYAEQSPRPCRPDHKSGVEKYLVWVEPQITPRR